MRRCSSSPQLSRGCAPHLCSIASARKNTRGRERERDVGGARASSPRWRAPAGVGGSGAGRHRRHCCRSYRPTPPVPLVSSTTDAASIPAPLASSSARRGGRCRHHSCRSHRPMPPAPLPPPSPCRSRHPPPPVPLLPAPPPSPHRTGRGEKRRKKEYLRLTYRSHCYRFIMESVDG